MTNFLAVCLIGIE